MPTPHIYSGPPCRLDKALEDIVPTLGLRGRRRLIDSGMVQVMGRVRAAGYVVREGAEICLVATAEGSQQEQQGELAFAVPHAHTTQPLSQPPSHCEQSDDRPAAEQRQNCTPPPHETSAQHSPAASTPACTEAPRFLEQQGGYCFFFKPAGLHSVALRGGTSPSLESLLPQLLQGVTLHEAQDNFLVQPAVAAQNNFSVQSKGLSSAAPAALPATVHCPQANKNSAPAPAPAPELPLLVQRLDCNTSGIVAAALRPAIAAEWRDAETRGLCRKRYLALLCGELPQPRTATAALDTCQRKRTRVLPREDAPLRHTTFTPLARFSDGMAAAVQTALAPQNTTVPVLTLAGCTIGKGARHQIRAHAAALGLPLWGDAQYGGGQGCFFLHHGGLAFLGKHIVLTPQWLDAFPAEIRTRAEQWLKKGIAP